MFRRTILAAIAMVGVVPDSLQASGFASPEQVLCMSSYVFVGRVLAANNPSAAHQGEPSRPQTKYPERNVIELQIAVDRILGAARPPSGWRSVVSIDDSDVIEARTQAWPVKGGKGLFQDQGGLVFDAATLADVPNEVVHEAYVGRKFLFSSRTHAAWFRPGERLYVVTWPLEKQEWALRTMSDVTKNASGLRFGCPTPR